jgi:integrase
MVYKRGSVWWYEFIFKGERFRESTKQRNQTVARQIEAAHKTSLAKGEVGIREQQNIPTLAEFAPRFCAAVETNNREKPATIVFYKAKLAYLLKYANLKSHPLNEIKERDIADYVNSRLRQPSERGRPLSIASVNRELATLRKLLRLAQEWHVIDRVPRIRLLSGEQGRDFVLSPAQEKIYLGAAPQDLVDLAILMLDTGLRVGETLALEWPQVHLEPAGTAKLGYLIVRARSAKNSRRRNIPLTARAVQMLRKRRPTDAGLVFQKNGEGLYQTWVNQQHAALRTLLKLPADFVPHSFRHTYGTRLGEAGADAFTIMRLMGHSSVTVSQKYVHPTPESMERAVERLEALNAKNLSAPPTDSPTVIAKPERGFRVTSA